MEFTFDENILSDLHKDARGFRPSASYMMNWNAMSDADKQTTWNNLVEEVERSIDEDKAREAEAVENFKKLIQIYVDNGAADEETALRWLTSEEEFKHEQDIEHFAWKADILHTKYGEELIKKIISMNGV
jgi:predicted Fe-S protein YdhL (DUF1289 family)